MTIDEYSKQAMTTDTFNGQKITSITDAAVISKILGLVGESGEVAEKFKKIIRDKNALCSPDDILDIQKELGDVLWYVNAICVYLGVSLEQTAHLNLEKVLGRKKRGKTAGSGDNR